MTQSIPQDSYPIVVGVDFAETGHNALRAGVRSALMRPSAVIHVVWVVPNSEKSSRSIKVIARRSEALAEAPRRLRAYLAEQAKAIEGLAGLKVIIHARLGSPAEAILQLCVDVGAELVVVGTHGYRGVKRVVLGSVAQDLVEIARCPVLVARPRDYKGLPLSAKPDPLCPECIKTRAASEGATLWCEYHSRSQVRPHAYGTGEVFHVGGHDPGIGG
ncbi:MAG: universal stress protein [Deltaproteobacteria bacterium]